MIASAVLIVTALERGNRTFTLVLIGALIAFGGFLAALNYFQFKQLVDRTPIPNGMAFFEGFRRALVADGRPGAMRWVNHPVLMTTANVGGWLLGSVALALRVAH